MATTRAILVAVPLAGTAAASAKAAPESAVLPKPGALLGRAGAPIPRALRNLLGNLAFERPAAAGWVEHQGAGRENFVEHAVFSDVWPPNGCVLQ